MVYNCGWYGMMGYGLNGGLMMLLYYLVLIGIVVALALWIKKQLMEIQNKSKRKNK